MMIEECTGIEDRRVRPFKAEISINTAQFASFPPDFLTNSLAAHIVPPVAKTSSTIKTESEEFMASL